MFVYTVQKGDTLWKIAKANHIGLDALLAANPQITDPNYIMAGSQINIPELWGPATGEYPNNQTEPPMDNSNDDIDVEDLPSCSDDPSVRPCIYVAQEGDTLVSIGQVFMVPLSRLLYYNLSYAKDEPLAAGTRIIIPERVIMPVNPVRNHTTGSGDGNKKAAALPAAASKRQLYETASFKATINASTSIPWAKAPCSTFSKWAAAQPRQPIPYCINISAVCGHCSTMSIMAHILSDLCHVIPSSI